MNAVSHPHRTPLLAALAMVLALALWMLWSWQGYSERSQEWRRQRAQDNFENLSAVIAAMGNGEFTDWDQIETVLGSITKGSRTLFVVVQGRHGRLLQIGTPPEFLMTNSTRGESATDAMYVIWAPLHPSDTPSGWSEALNATGRDFGRWPSGNPVMYMGTRSGTESFYASWYWQRQAPIFAAALICIAAVSIAWSAAIRRRILTAELASERIRSAHLEELGLAAAGLAHETKNPLGIIMGMAQQIAARPDTSADSRVMLEHIMDEVDKATSRLGNFMNFARQRKPALAPVRLDSLCTEVATVMRPDFEAGGVELDTDAPGCTILADGSMLRQILVNLLLNSLHASPAGTAVRIGVQRQGRRMQLTVQDQGMGIAPELLPDIFKPYTSGSATGHGLGLAIVKRMVEAHGWRIQAASVPGGGATMTITGIKTAGDAA